MADFAPNEHGNFELELTIKVEVDPQAVGYGISNQDLVDLLISRIRSLDLVAHAE
jgi:hypothetical protein